MNLSKYIELLEELFEPAYIVDCQQTIVFWNKPAEELTGYKASMIVGTKCNDNILMHINDQGERICITQCPLITTMQSGIKTNISSYLQHETGYRIPVDSRFIPISSDDGINMGTIEIFVKKGQVNETSKSSIIKELVKTAYIDSVTQLPNKEYMENKITTLLLEARDRPGEVALGLLSVEIQNLRDFNNLGGLVTGNLLLKVVAQTLGATLELEEGSFVCKWYGGLFVIFMNTNRISTLLNWANKLKLILEKSTVPGHDEQNIKVGIGGIATQSGEIVTGAVLKRLEWQLQLSKSASSGISIT